MYTRYNIYTRLKLNQNQNQVRTMDSTNECPICMDCLDVNKNCTTTECGHCFHTSCLMRSVVHNGFGCPYCRTVMAEEPEDSDEEEEDDERSTESDDEEDEEEIEDQTHRAFRFFFSRVEEDQDILQPEDDAEEDEYETNRADPIEGEAEVDHEGVPTAKFVTDRLIEQGITFDQVIDLMLRSGTYRYAATHAIVEDFDNELYGRMNRIVDRYIADQPAPVVPNPNTQVTPIDSSAQPKTPSVIETRHSFYSTPCIK